MHINFQPQSQLEKFGFKIFYLLVENFPQTFFAGGTVRDILLNKKPSDIDLATAATPQQVIFVLKNFCDLELKGQTFGVVIAKRGELSAEIATFRKDTYGNSRYPKVTFVKTAKIDSQRRDFTVNSLYFSPKTAKIFDFCGGLGDIRKRRLRLVGNPAVRLKEDPLRIIRAIRFSVSDNFKIEKNTLAALKKYFHLKNLLTASRQSAELEKIKNKKFRTMAKQALDNKFLLDKFKF